MTLKNLLWAGFILAAPLALAQFIPGRYIVELRTEPAAEVARRIGGKGALRSAAVQDHKRRIAAEQDAVAAEIVSRRGTVIERTSTVGNLLMVKGDQLTATALAEIPGVKRVQPARRVRPLLDRAVALHKVDEAWNQIGIDNAGAGMKIGILDTGIEPTHAAFQDSSLAAPEGFPKTNRQLDKQYTSGKIIVARSYVALLDYEDWDYSILDHVGHGTALASITAGVRNAGPLATITGVAPKAYIGVYKIFGSPYYNDYSSDDVIVKALDDAVADGMDVVNLSLGFDTAPRLEDDVDVDAVERASKAGVIVVTAAGNNGSDLATVSSPATAPSAIAAGASTNSRTFGYSVLVSGLTAIYAVPGDGPVPGSAVTGAVADMAAIENGDGLFCEARPAGSLDGKVALIQRGTCTFETKINNAQKAGAAAAVIYTRAESPSLITMSVGTATLPAVMVVHDDGVAIRKAAAADPAATATVNARIAEVPVAASQLAGFSAAGPNVNLGIKPDLLAAGADIYMATQTYDYDGSMYMSSGYILENGTSFSSPIVAGSAALLKAARPGLTVDQYRSLLINSAAPVGTGSGAAPLIQRTGAGVLDVQAALRSNLVSAPVSVSFGAGGGTIDQSQAITLTNIGTSKDTFSIATAALHGEAGPAAAVSSVELEPGATTTVGVEWKAAGLAGGTYDGYITITSQATGSVSRVPYWYASATGVPATVTLLYSDEVERRGEAVADAFLFRATDVSGLVMGDVEPEVTLVTGSGSVRKVNNWDKYVPGMFGVDLVAGLGTNVFQVKVGDAKLNVTIVGQ